jgi:hypothetical protein
VSSCFVVVVIVIVVVVVVVIVVVVVVVIVFVIVVSVPSVSSVVQNSLENRMKFMLTFRYERDTEIDLPPCKDLDAMKTFAHDLAQKGILLSTEGLYPTSRGARVRIAHGKTSVIDGPFTEAKEFIAGFAIVQVPSKHEAITLAKQFLTIAGEGFSEVREIIES